jgi:hypothetical protein
MFQKDQATHNFNLSVCPGISSFDTMLNDLSLDPLEQGTCLIDANLFVLLNYRLEPLMNYFIYHICSVGTTRTHISDAAKDNHVHFLKTTLLGYFPPEHRVRLVSSSSHQPGTSTIVEVELAALETILDQVTFTSTLFVPGMKPGKERINTEFLAALRQPH